jgi:hypothetical protein
VSEHRARVLDAMGEHAIEALVLGQEANARYVSGANRLWLAGTRPFAPGCVVVRSTGAVHLLSVTDDGLPDDIALDELYPISWNPTTMAGALAAIPGMGDARRIGVDGMTPMFDQLLCATFPPAELVDGAAVMRAVRRIKTDADRDAIRSAVAIADAVVDAGAAGLRPDADPVHVAALVEEARCEWGVTTPACATDVRIGDELAALRVGVLAGGWEGISSGTVRIAGDGAISPEWHTDWHELRARVCLGAPAGSLRGPGVVLHGVGTGYEPIADDEELTAGMVVFLELDAHGARGGDTIFL